MATYEETMQSLGQLAVHGFDILKDTYSELLLSLPNEKQLGLALGSWLKLNWKSFEPPMNDEDAFRMLERALANLLKGNKLQLADYGMSTIGREQFNSLVASVTPTPVVVAPSPEKTHAQAIREYQTLPGDEYNRLWKTSESFRKRADDAAAAGVL